MRMNKQKPVKKARSVFEAAVTEGLTEAQRELRCKHGDPAQFAVACYAAVPGDISMAETRLAVAKYQREWDAAGLSVEPNKFAPVKAWRLRQHLDKHVGAVEEMCESMVGSRNRKEFNRGNFDYCVNQMVVLTRRLKRFYLENK